MSRAFVKDLDDTVEELPDRPISSHPNLVTAEGLAHIEAEVARLQQEHAAAHAAGDRTALAASAGSRVRITDDDTWSDIFSKVLVEHVEPKLGQGRLTVLFEYPAPEAALARPKPADPRVAERFEIYACGVELANGFGELTDATEQRRRFASAMDEKQRRYGERYPLDEDFLRAVAAMPPSSGVALGFDRLVMLASGATRIDQVVWTPPAGEQ